MVYLKKILVIILSFLIAIIFIEIITRYIICYPEYGVEYKLKGIRSSENGIQNIYYPYSKYWNVEGGNLVAKRNNLGFPGIDVNLSDTAKYIFLLGDSFAESYPIAPEKMPTTIFQKMLDENNKSKYQIINLGVSGHDTYDIYLRANYYSRIFNPKLIFILLNQNCLQWLKRHNIPLNFDLSFQKPEVVNSLYIKSLINLRNFSSFTNLIVLSFLDQTNNNNSKFQTNSNNNVSLSNSDFSLLDTTLLEINKKFNKKVIFISISDLKNFNDNLQIFCKEHDIKFVNENIDIPENKIKGVGHLNEKGCRELGELFYKCFKEYENY